MTYGARARRATASHSFFPYREQPVLIVSDLESGNENSARPDGQLLRIVTIDTHIAKKNLSTRIPFIVCEGDRGSCDSPMSASNGPQYAVANSHQRAFDGT